MAAWGQALKMRTLKECIAQASQNDRREKGRYETDGPRTQVFRFVLEGQLISLYFFTKCNKTTPLGSCYPANHQRWFFKTWINRDQILFSQEAEVTFASGVLACSCWRIVDLLPAGMYGEYPGSLCRSMVSVTVVSLYQNVSPTGQGLCLFIAVVRHPEQA